MLLKIGETFEIMYYVNLTLHVLLSCMVTATMTGTTVSFCTLQNLKILLHKYSVKNSELDISNFNNAFKNRSNLA